MAYPFDTPAVLQRLKALTDAQTNVANPRIGFPGTWPDRFSVFLGLAGQGVNSERPGVLERQSRFLVMAGYRIDPTTEAATENAELAIAGLLDTLIPALYGDAALNALLVGLEADSNVSDTAEYQMYSAQEVRLYGISVRGQQWAAY